MSPSADSLIQQLKPFLDKPEPSGSRVIMLCGIAGAGKSTLAKAIVSSHPSFHRLSTDQIIYETKGLYMIDYPATQYQTLSAQAQKCLISVFSSYLERRRI
jgi:GTP-binding protein EngB required for normal cell division